MPASQTNRSAKRISTKHFVFSKNAQPMASFKATQNEKSNLLEAAISGKSVLQHPYQSVSSIVYDTNISVVNISVVNISNSWDDFAVRGSKPLPTNKALKHTWKKPQVVPARVSLPTKTAKANFPRRRPSFLRLLTKARQASQGCPYSAQNDWVQVPTRQRSAPKALSDFNTTKVNFWAAKDAPL